MDTLIFVFFGIIVVMSSACATYAINISRERLWLTSKKTEEIYHKADELCYQLAYFFDNRYDLVQIKTFPRNAQDVRALNSQISELNVLIGLYLPALGDSLSAALAATSSTFHWLGVAEMSEEADREHALHSLDFAVSETKSAFDRLKKSALSVGSVDHVGRFYDRVLNRRRHVQSDRILALSA